MLRILSGLLVISVLAITQASAQPFFNRYDSIPVTANGNNLKYAWAGGLNSCQLSTIDLNMDGIEDLFVFDRAGNKITTFINNGTSGTIDYTLAPQYRSMFINQHDDRGTFHDWIFLRDYDNDGKKDIYTYSNGAAAVYHNITQSADSIAFELKTSFLKSNYNPNYLALYISAVDLPSIIDVDNDGDLDILTFHIYGTVIEFHSNQSQELYGNSDSLIYKLYDNCWGDFSENATSNSVFLDTCIGVTHWIDSIEHTEYRIGGSRHSGSATLALDMNNDGVKEFMLGDISFNNVTLLSNDGTLLDAHMYDQSSTAPPNTTPVNLPIFPGMFYEDINNDNVKDLIVSPNTTNITENFESLWLYTNNGATSQPDFELTQKNFLQDNMIEVGEVSFPVFFDADNDGLSDLIVGNYGYYSASGTYPSKLSYYRNTGTSTDPSFELITRDYAGIEFHEIGIRSLAPTFGDIDGDGVTEMLIGDIDGKLHLFENNAQPGQPANFVLSAPNYSGIDVGSNATPQLFDVNGDSLPDLIIGERNSNLNYYENTGTTSTPVFTLVSENFGDVDVTKVGFNVGYTVPFMFRFNDQLQLFVGSESGDIYQYTGIEETLLAGNDISIQIGQGNTVSPDAQTTPFGSEFRNGRNQFLIKKEELQAAGFQNGILKKIGFNVVSADTGTIRNFKIDMANREPGSFTDFEALNFTNVYFSDFSVSSPGWNEITLDEKFTWNTEKDLVIQVCFDTTISTINTSSVYCSSTPFVSNIGASANNVTGCSMSSTVSGTLRPNMKLSMRPSFPRKGALTLFEGVRSSVNGTDLNNDGMMDIVIGNYTGGVSYYKGDTTGITTNIYKPEKEETELTLFPNPSDDNITLNLSKPLQANALAQVFSLTGQVMHSSQIPSGQTKIAISTSGLSSGIYLIRVAGTGNLIVKKFIVSH